ncbi:2-oxo acid dehydrogenase subunit E2 [Pseudenhygromyxa sp. WMMC2535]|uniref:2-oxo acid dehydrogenase subunit E2 n=1 Tax=Pseudenhygromyxa sp. WMMC2535 TaxID=2712867 RepID=UPI001558129B|nr:2-oxo acid dehydrogenase subunit E2 [Pseudenhygromyxa sp. WMMC2535]NVB39749.1 2-oxo acid dehydrogenase subunit E2 [Pseudenhygromyxa sp. WMMC2535]
MAKMTVRRKLAIATWRSPSEGNIYGKMTVDAENALRYIEHLRAETGEKVTMTHLVGKAAGMALAQAPTLNGFLRFGRYHPHERVNVAFLVALEGGRNLAKAKVEDIDQKPVTGIAGELRALATKLHRGEDEQFEKTQGPLHFLPTWIIRPLVHFTGWLTGALGLDMRGVGLEPFPFGACIVTSVGMFGLDEAFVPPTPFARVPVYVLIGAVRPAATVVDGALEVRNQVTITATIDHRFIDGFQGGVLAKVVKQVILEPWTLDGLDAPPWASAPARTGPGTPGLAATSEPQAAALGPN